MLAARSRSASPSTIIGSLPPSSSETGMRRSAARAMIFLPVRVDPATAVLHEPGPQVAELGRAPLESERVPRRLGRARTIDDRRDRGGVHVIDVADDLSRCGVLDRDALPRGGGGAVGLDGDFGV